MIGVCAKVHYSVDRYRNDSIFLFFLISHIFEINEELIFYLFAFRNIIGIHAGKAQFETLV